MDEQVIKQMSETLAAEFQKVAKVLKDLTERVEALEEKKTAGRPKKDAE